MERLAVNVPNSVEDPRFPKVVGRTRPTALEIATTINETGKLVIDPVVHKSVGSMDGKE